MDREAIPLSGVHRASSFVARDGTVMGRAGGCRFGRRLVRLPAQPGQGERPFADERSLLYGERVRQHYSARDFWRSGTYTSF